MSETAPQTQTSALVDGAEQEESLAILCLGGPLHRRRRRWPGPETLEVPVRDDGTNYLYRHVLLQENYGGNTFGCHLYVLDRIAMKGGGA